MMLRIILSVIIPVAIAFTGCIYFNDIVPALTIGVASIVVLVASIFAVYKSNHLEEGIACMLLITLPALIVAVILLGGSGIYCLVGS